MSPAIILRRFETVMKHGKAAAKQGRHKQEREAWISAVWSLGLHEITGNEYWIEIETRDATPDCKVHFIDPSSGNNNVMTINVEVVEWEEHRDDVMDVIAPKCAKAYPAFFFLVVFCRNGKNIDVQSLMAKMGELTVPFGEVWVLGRLSNVGTAYSMFRLHPGSRLVEFDLRETIAKDKRNIDFLTRMGRGKGTAFEELGPIYLPIKNL